MSAQDQDTQRLGQQIGSYQLIDFLGKGGFADVYLGEHIYLHTQNAIKILRVQLSEDSLQDFLVGSPLLACREIKQEFGCSRCLSHVPLLSNTP